MTFHGREQRRAVVEVDPGIYPAAADDRQRHSAARLPPTASDDLSQGVLDDLGERAVRIGRELLCLG
jgi:hypothetical protein